MAASKRMKASFGQIDRSRVYPLAEAVAVLKATSATKFDESVDLAINLGVDPKHADQMVRGSIVLPHGTGKSLRVLVFAKGDKEKEAREAGADYVGAEDLAKKITDENWLDFERVIAAPDMMGVVGRLGKVLGPRGLMPNPKVGTVSADVALAVRNAKAGQVQYRTDKAGIVQCTIGRASFTPDQLKTNLTALIDALSKARPQGMKGIYFKKVSISSTMGAGVRVDPVSLNIAQSVAH